MNEEIGTRMASKSETGKVRAMRTIATTNKNLRNVANSGDSPLGADSAHFQHKRNNH